ncbi:IclR family transcriptional regulator domain-containing protein [Paraburkholderia aspalathi]|uniref:IclR family transcriptional regulator domain-containing protein n=1 Tax=Paraburkholderia aspalathi TaxID=1324617 RepID=UPI001FD5A739|nr:IclR family transcriptional regulator C-terminal domain-containing protein [Paraburkholderia aspalathi]
MGLEKGLSVIEAFGMKKGPLTVTQAADITGHTKGSVRRSLLTLCRLGYATQDGYSFVLAPRALRLGYAYVVSDPLTKVAQPILEITSERTLESASIAVLDLQDAVFVARSTHRRSLSSGLGVGSRLPAYCSATGRVLLSGRPPAEVRFMLNRMARPALTPHTLTTITRIMKEIEFVGRHGYAIIDEELEIGIRSIAVPIRNARGEMIAAMSLSVSTSRMTREGVVEYLLPELESARRHLAALL